MKDEVSHAAHTSSFTPHPFPASAASQSFHTGS